MAHGAFIWQISDIYLSPIFPIITRQRDALLNSKDWIIAHDCGRWSFFCTNPGNWHSFEASKAYHAHFHLEPPVHIKRCSFGSCAWGQREKSHLHLIITRCITFWRCLTWKCNWKLLLYISSSYTTSRQEESLQWILFPLLHCLALPCIAQLIVSALHCNFTLALLIANFM